jgi:hypothetical protein
MPLQNRVTPFGDLTISPARGLLMGNRGGRLHTAQRRLGTRRWASKQWICCRLEFNNRHRSVWGSGYSELFFLDEVTALAAGHRPCFECRRSDAQAFAAAFPGAPRGPAMDAVLHAERLAGRAKRRHRRSLDALPDGAMIAQDGRPFAIKSNSLLPWTPSGYGPGMPRRRGIDADVLTPPSIVAALQAGYTPLWHPTAF